MSGPRFLAQPCAARRLCCAWRRSGKRILLSCLKGKTRQHHQGINAGVEFDGHNRAAARTKGAPSGHGCRARGPSAIQKVGGNDSGRSRVTVTAVCPLCKATVTQYHIRCRAAVWQQAAPPISKDRQACGHRSPLPPIPGHMPLRSTAASPLLLAIICTGGLASSRSIAPHICHGRFHCTATQ